MDILLLYALITSVVYKVDIPKLLRHLFEKYENLDIDLFLSIFDFACTPKEELISDSELLSMIDVYKDSQRMKVI